MSHVRSESETGDCIAKSPVKHNSTIIDRKQLPNYAKDTLKQVLGWYGLQEGCGGASSKEEDSSDKVPSADVTTESQQQVQSCVTGRTDDSAATTPSSCSSVSVEDEHHPPSKADVVCLSPKSSSALARETTPDTPLDLTSGSGLNAVPPGGEAGLSTVPGGSRRLVGMRFLFPPLPEEMSLLDKARIWVARHEHKYFVGWSREQLEYVDPLLRPISVISPAAYKLNMNRSEYCRNVKLKYCLESDASWAQEFRLKLSKPPSEGGFTGLCQAKIAAAELWRKYSENYRSHQARYPNPKSKYKSRWMSSKMAAASGGKREVEEGRPDEERDGDEKKRRLTEGVNDDDYEEVDIYGMDDSRSARDVDQEEGDEGNLDSSVGSNLGGAAESVDGEGSLSGVSVQRGGNDVHSSRQKTAWKSNEGGAAEPYTGGVGGLPELFRETNNNKTIPAECDAVCQDVKPAMDISSRSLENLAITQAGCFPGLLYYNMALPLYQRSLQQLASVPMATSSAASKESVSRQSSPTPSDSQSCNKSTPSPSMSIGSTKCSSNNLGGLVDKQQEYKRSERGLSFLFPSLSDHNLTLMDKVHITVLRHKNNYFLGWSEEELAKVDPIVRPKMLVSQEIYKEYCHRNAMKYDSNLQFAIESQEQWAKEFLTKLMKPPSEGGFSSLCEVKLEAGRLWREYSGKYRMHNIVKWQMDLNTSSSSTPAASVPPNVIIKQEAPDDASLSAPSLPGKHATSTTSCSLDLAPLLRASDNYTNISPNLKEESSLSKSPSSASLTLPEGGQNHINDATTPRSESISGPKGANYPQSLFIPLPHDMPAADQLFVWLERHRQNYYLGFTSEELSRLNPYLRPQFVVNQETFKRCIPESMVDVLNKIELIMGSLQPWAQHFRDRLCQSAIDGGFSSFEEALTEAVVSWHAHSETVKTEGRSAGGGEGVGLYHPTPVIHPQKDVLYNNWLSQQQQSNKLPQQNHSNESQSKPSDPSESSAAIVIPATTVNGKGTHGSPTGNSSSTCKDPTAPSKTVMATSLLSLTSSSDLSLDLWGLRRRMVEVCKDDPQQSWCDRLTSFLPTLRRHLGIDYQVPDSTNGCVVDLVLSLLQNHLDSKLKQS